MKKSPDKICLKFPAQGTQMRSGVKLYGSIDLFSNIISC